MASTVLVTGGTGTLGRRVVAGLHDAGRPVRVLSRRPRQDTEGVQYVVGNLATGEGVDAAVADVATIVHCASDKKGDDEATRTLVRAAEAAGSPHLVFISIVGVDQVSFGYFKAKLRAEQAVTGSGLPWTLLRTTQFYDMILAGARKAGYLPVQPVPSGFKVQPIDSADVADRLVELALGEPAGRVPDLPGPERTDAAEMIRDYLRARGRRPRVLPVPMPGTGRIRAGALLPDEPAPGAARGRRTWTQFLADAAAKPA
jgi:uncharacterized protein YbjT (DUF2867 family)